MPAPLRFADIPTGVEAPADQPTDFESIPAPVEKADVPVPPAPLAQKPELGPDLESVARRKAFNTDQAVTAAEQLGGADEQPTDVDRLEGILFGVGINGGVDRKLAVAKLAKQTGLPTATIEADYDRISETWANATSVQQPALRRPGQLPLEQPYKRPGQKFLEEQPELAQALLRNPLLGFVSKEKQISTLHKAWNSAADFAFDAPIIGAHNLLSEEQQQQLVDARKKRDEPKQELVLQDEQARQMQDGWVDVSPDPTSPVMVPRRALVPFLRAKESWAGLQISKAYDDLANLESAGADTSQKELEIADLEQQAVRRDYGEGALAQIFSDAGEGIASSADVAIKGGVGGAAGALGGAVVGKTPAAIARGFAIGSKLGAAYGTFHLERGSAYKEMLQATRADGSPAMDRQTARLASAVYGLLATPIESASWGPMFTAMGPLGALIKTGETKAFTDALVKNPAFLATLKKVAGELVSVGMAEGGEEFLQDATQQAVEYFARSHAAGQFVTGPNGEVDLDKSLEAWGKGVPGGLAGALVSENVNLATQMLFRDSALVQTNKLRAIVGLDKSPVAQSAPQVVSDMIAAHTAESGTPATHAYVTAREFTRLFQEEGADPDAAARELLGPDGPQKLADAVAAGGRLEVPLEQYVQKWVPTETAKRLLQHTAFSDEQLTAAEAKALPIESMAEELAKKVLGSDEQTAKTQFDRLEEQMVASGRFTPKDAARNLAPLRAAVRTAAVVFKQDAAKLFEQYGLTYGAGDEALSVTLGAPADSRFLTKAWLAQNVEGKVRSLYIDTTTGALNARAHARVKAGADKHYAFSVEGIKFSNDEKGHDAGNAVYRAAAQALSPLLARGLFKPGGDFASFGPGQEHLDQVLAKANEHAALQGFRITGAIGDSYREAVAENNRHKKVLEAAQQRAARGQRPLTATGNFTGGGEKLVGTKIEDGLREAFTKLPPAAAFDETYVDKPTGLLNKDGFEASAPKKFQLSVDFDGVKEMVDLFGDAQVDRLVALAGNKLRELGGHEVSAAHFSGDEFGGKHDDGDGLTRWATRAQAFMQTFSQPVELTEAAARALGLSSTRVTLHGLPLSFGVGQTLDQADEALNRQKLERQAQGLRGEGAVARRLVGAAEEGGQGVGQRAGEAGGRAELGPASAADQVQGQQRGGQQRPHVAPLAQDFGRQRFFDVGRLEAPADQGVPRGYTDVIRTGMERIFRIALNPKADRSTFQHESGHVFLELLADLSERTDAPPRYKQMFADATKWLGVASRSEIGREQHEKFARGYEAYLFEGKAPSAKLAGVFATFKLWLKKVYRDIRALNVELNDEIRSVYDRLLATDDELMRQERRMGTLAPFAQDLLGMSDADYLEYAATKESGLEHASLQADLRVLKDLQRETEAWWRDEHKEELEKARDAYELLPARQAQQHLRGRAKGAATPIALDRQAVEDAVGPEKAKKFQLRKKGGESPDQVAGFFGYPTGKAMLDDVLQLPEKEKWAKGEAVQAMAEKHPGVLDDRQKLAELISKGLHGDMTLRWLTREWVALKRKVTPPGQPMWTAETAPLATLKLAAEKIVDRTRVGRLAPGAVLAAERAAADAAVKAAAKDEFGKAFMQKQEQLLNMFRFKKLGEARELREKFLNLVGELVKDKARARLGKARAIYRDTVDALLEALQLREPNPDSPGASISELITQMDADGQTIGIDEDELQRIVVTPRGWKDLTVAELRTVHNTLLSIKAAATGVTTALYGEKRMDAEELEQLLLDESGKHAVPPQPPLASSESAKTRWQSFRSWVVGVDGSLLRPELLLRMYMGEAWVKAFVDPLQKSKHREIDLLKGVIKPVIDAMDAIPRSVRNTLDDAIDGKALFPDHKVEYDQNLQPPSRRHELLLIALNAGTDSNLSRLTIGRNITLEQVHAAIDLLTKDELHWVESVWKASETLWPHAAELEERDSGLPPERLEPRPLITKHGTFSGGYFPAVYDWRVEAAGERQAANTVAALMDPRYVRPGTAQNHLKGRVEGFTGVIALEASTIKRALGQVAHDIAYREAVKSVGQLLMRPALRAELNNRMGYERASQLLAWVRDTGQMRGLEGALKTEQYMKVVKYLKGGQIVSVLGYSATTFLGDLANFLTAVPRSGLQLKHLAAAVLEFTTHPANAMNEALSLSGELRSRRQGLIKKLERQVRDLSKSSFVGLRAMRWVTDHAFAFLEFSDAISTAPVWMGAYRQALEQGSDGGAAVRAADSMLRDNFPAESTVDLPGVLRDQAFLGQSMMFYRYFSVVYNSMRDIVHPLVTAKDPVEFARALPRASGRLLGFLTVAVVLSELLSGRGPEDGEDWDQWYWRKMLFGALSSIPLVGDAGALIEAKVLGKHINPRGTVLVNLFAQLGDGASKLSSDDPDAEKKAKALMQTIAPLLKLPVSQPLRSESGIAAQVDPSRAARNPFDLGSDVVYGNRPGQPKNPLSIAGDALSGGPR